MIRSGQVRYYEGLADLMVPIDSVTQHPENYNNGDVEEIAVSIELDGMYRPIQVQESTGHIVMGNHTWEACKALGATVIPVVTLPVDNTQARRMMFTDNRLASLARPDLSAEIALLEQIREAEPDLPIPGLTEHDLMALKALAEMVTEYDEYAQWPTLTFQVHPRLVTAFRHITREATTDRDRFELLLRLSGWDGT